MKTIDEIAEKLSKGVCHSCGTPLLLLHSVEIQEALSQMKAEGKNEAVDYIKKNSESAWNCYHDEENLDAREVLLETLENARK